MQKLNRAERTLWTQLGREPTLEEIADEAAITLQQALEVRAAARASASLDAPVGDTDEAVLGDFVAGQDPLPEERVELELRSRALFQALASLAPRDRQVVVLRYGIGGTEPRTLEEIGRSSALTRERVRQIELDSLRRLAAAREIQAVGARRSGPAAAAQAAASPRPAPASGRCGSEVSPPASCANDPRERMSVLAANVLRPAVISRLRRRRTPEQGSAAVRGTSYVRR